MFCKHIVKYIWNSPFKMWSPTYASSFSSLIRSYLEQHWQIKKKCLNKNYTPCLSMNLDKKKKTLFYTYSLAPTTQHNTHFFWCKPIALLFYSSKGVFIFYYILKPFSFFFVVVVLISTCKALHTSLFHFTLFYFFFFTYTTRCCTPFWNFSFTEIAN